MLTVNNEYISEIVVDKSRFIALLIPLSDDSNFKDLIKSYKAEYKKARHICYAYRIGNMKSKSSDDGEPSGTAGRPLLELLYKKDLTNVALIVVRYFGGVKLGAGRLLRTYVQAGVNVINSAELVSVE